MYNPSNKQITVVVYDGIGNSVFASQVLAPLLEMLKKSDNLEITIISYERQALSPTELMQRFPADDRLHLVIFKKLPFFGKLTLWPGAWKLFRYLCKFPCHEILARGPLAGWIAGKALAWMAWRFPKRLRAESLQKMPTLTVQARGLCADEYRYAHMRVDENNQPQKPFWEQWFNKLMYRMLHSIEFEVYRNKRKTDYPHDVTLEAVSPALKEHLIKQFRADEAKVILAMRDIPKTIDKEQAMQWRTEIRQQLGIPADAYVYCYSGSYKPWQCADQTIEFFAEKHADNHKNYLLILSPDVQAFAKVLKESKVPEHQYKVMNVSAKDLLKYLAAADAGFLFREPDVINWVSRPTKMLEYQAVGLKVIHNSTIAWLVNQGS